MKTLTAAAPLGALTAFSSLQVAVAQSSALTHEWVQLLEASLDLNVALNATPHLEAGAPRPVAEYARDHRMVERDGRRVAEAVFAPPVELHPSDGRISRYTPNGMEDLGPTPKPSAEARNMIAATSTLTSRFPSFSTAAVRW
ncbi:MAG: hypothetical protein ACOH1H_13560 [Brevundimonas sp.]|jgi:hypothetical protein